MQILEPPSQPQHRVSAIDRHPTPAPVFSIVGPVYNEEALLEEFCQRMIEVLESLGEPFELVLVNDGSRDRSPTILRRLHALDPRVKVINFSRNFGLQAALWVSAIGAFLGFLPVYFSPVRQLREIPAQAE